MTKTFAFYELYVVYVSAGSEYSYGDVLLIRTHKQFWTSTFWASNYYFAINLRITKWNERTGSPSRNITFISFFPCFMKQKLMFFTRVLMGRFLYGFNFIEVHSQTTLLFSYRLLRAQYIPYIEWKSTTFLVAQIGTKMNSAQLISEVTLLLKLVKFLKFKKKILLKAP